MQKCKTKHEATVTLCCCLGRRVQRMPDIVIFEGPFCEVVKPLFKCLSFSFRSSTLTDKLKRHRQKSKKKKKEQDQGTKRRNYSFYLLIFYVIFLYKRHVEVKINVDFWTRKEGHCIVKLHFGKYMLKCWLLSAYAWGKWWVHVDQAVN